MITTRSDQIRAFVAAIPPEDILDRMAALVARLRSLAPYRWAGRTQLHLTLRFLGETLPGRLDGFADALSKTNAGNAFDVRLDRAGGFPNLARPRALWLGGDEGTKELTDLAARIEKTAQNSGFPAGGKRFSAHLTLARLRDEGAVPPMLLKALEAVPVFEWHCDRFFLMKSRLTPTGPIYTVLREYPLE